MAQSPHGSDAPPLAEMLTAAEVAKALRVSVQTISRWAADGTLPSVKFGNPTGKGPVRFRREDVEKIIEGGARDEVAQ